MAIVGASGGVLTVKIILESEINPVGSVTCKVIEWVPADNESVKNCELF